MSLGEDDYLVLLGTPEEVIVRALAITLDEYLKALAHITLITLCLLYTSDAADDSTEV